MYRGFESHSLRQIRTVRYHDTMASFPMVVAKHMPPSLQALAYRAQQATMMYSAVFAQRGLRRVLRRKTAPGRQAQREVARLYQALLARDLKNVEIGAYPDELLFQMPVVDYLKQIPRLALDIPRTVRRMRAGRYRDLPGDVKLDRYPPYYRRNFHWQTDGYLSRSSAQLYDVGVEFLFLGTADIMRRQVIPPVTDHLRSNPNADRVLDVACGTGRTLLQLAHTHPKLRFTGLDLSPYYVQHARQLLAEVEDLSLIADNAEAMPFADETFDVLTCVHLFHELPRPARHNVYREMLRTLKPGGLLVIEDSLQNGDSSTMSIFLQQFSKDFHEPFHNDYAKDDIGDALEEHGYEKVETELHFVAKVVRANKPS